MRYIGILIAIAFVVAAVTVAPTAEAAPACTGNACAWLRMDAAKCTVTNVGTGPLTVTFHTSGGTLTMGRVKPGDKVLVRGFMGCIGVRNIESYQVKALGTPPAGPSPTGVAIAVRMGFAKPHPCSGQACGAVRLLMEKGCAWLKNASRSRATVTVHLAHQTLNLSLPGAKKVAATSSSGAQNGGLQACALARRDLARVEDALHSMDQSQPRPSEAQLINAARAVRKACDTPAVRAAQCAAVRHSVANLKVGHIALSRVPRLAASYAKCQAMERAEKARKAALAKTATAPKKAPAGYYRRTWNAFSRTASEVYWMKVMSGPRCVASLNQVTDYVANYAAH